METRFLLLIFLSRTYTPCNYSFKHFGFYCTRHHVGIWTTIQTFFICLMIWNYLCIFHTKNNFVFWHYAIQNEMQGSINLEVRKQCLFFAVAADSQVKEFSVSCILTQLIFFMALTSCDTPIMKWEIEKKKTLVLVSQILVKFVLTIL